MNKHISPESLSANPVITPAELDSMVPKIYLDRRLKMVKRTWSIVMGKEMNDVVTHSFFTQQLFIRLAILKGLPRADIGEGCLMLVLHDKLEVILPDRNIYNRKLVTMDEHTALEMMEGGQITYPMVEKILSDYENGKKGIGADPRIVTIAKLCKDADCLETIVEQIEDAALDFNPMRFEDPRVKAECEEKRRFYHFDETRTLHDAIMEGGLKAVHDAFLDLDNNLKSGTYGRD